MGQMQLMRLFGPNLWGWLADRFGRRMAIIRLAAAAGLAGLTAVSYTHLDVYKRQGWRSASSP